MQTQLAADRLTDAQRELIGRCLRAFVDGPYVSNDNEFHTVMGVWRKEASAVAAEWPEPASNGYTFVTVNNTLNNLLGYPHGHWNELSDTTGADPQQLDAALARWRGEEVGEAENKGLQHFNRMM